MEPETQKKIEEKGFICRVVKLTKSCDTLYGYIEKSQGGTWLAKIEIDSRSDIYKILNISSHDKIEITIVKVKKREV